VIGKALGVLIKEWDETGGLDADVNPEAFHGPMLGKIVKAGLFEPLTIETTLDPKIQPFLYDHQIDGTPVLPGVMGIEAFAEAASCLLPEWHVQSVEEVSYEAPFKFYRSQPRTVTVEARIRPHAEDLVADCRLVGKRTLPTQKEPQVVLYFTARVRLSKEPRKPAMVPPPGSPTGSVVESGDIYRLYFHGPAYQVVEKAWWNGKQIVGLMSNSLPGNHQPAGQPTVVAPRLIELCFQTAGVWEMGVLERMGLPRGIDHVALQNPTETTEERLYAVVIPDQEHGSFDAEVVDSKGNRYLQLRGYRSVPVPTAVNAEDVKTLHALMSLEPIAA
jgi:hypothetical protein